MAKVSFASTFYLSPATTNIPSGSIVPVSIGVNTAGESINAVSTYLAYPSDKLEVAWVSYGGSFTIGAESSYGGGSIRISRGNIDGVLGNVNVATIGFKGKGLGQATVSFIGGSGAPRTSNSTDSLNLVASKGGVYIVGAAQPTVVVQKDTTKPVISNVIVSLISTNTATVTWQTNDKSDSTVEYGLDTNKYFIKANNQNLVTTHVITLVGPVLLPGATFHFRVKSKDEAGNEGVGNDSTFKLKGYNVTIKIVDLTNIPVKDTDVSLYTEEQKSRTNQNGEVNFTDVTPGKHVVVVKLRSFDRTGEIDVKDTLAPQSFSLKINTAPSKAFSAFNAASYALLIIIIGVLAILLVVARKRLPSS